ncbi:nuclease-related domain-containing protein [Neobacillus rhizosphaerae]|uniref:nuclease-related domain-containing protein n=1 Tax=Neobacillus rhizosphaerae TaxID=2880965 RepID=UPI003D2E9A48
MAYKERCESVELIILRLLSQRMTLEDKYKQSYHNLEKGYEGEVAFDLLTEKLSCRSFILNDLLLETSGAKFQIDSLIVTQEPIYLFEVKNYEGDYYYESGRFYTISKKEITNPLLQIERSESLLRQLLQNLGYRIPIKAYVVFINPEFYLYQAPLNKPIIYPNQLSQFMRKLNNHPSTLKDHHKRLADQLVSMHQIEINKDKIPAYDLNSIQKGINCCSCHSFSVTVSGRKLVCDVCGYTEDLDNSIMRGVNEFCLLFPNEQITTNVIHDWFQVLDSKKTFRRVLKKNCDVLGKKEFNFIKCD